MAGCLAGSAARLEAAPLPAVSPVGPPPVTAADVTPAAGSQFDAPCSCPPPGDPNSQGVVAWRGARQDLSLDEIARLLAPVLFPG